MSGVIPASKNGVTMQQLLQNFAFTQNRPTWIINPDPIQSMVPPGQQGIDYTQLSGNVPDIAQVAQANPTPPPPPGGYFTKAQQDLAEWFSQRTHLSPIGTANNG